MERNLAIESYTALIHMVPTRDGWQVESTLSGVASTSKTFRAANQLNKQLLLMQVSALQRLILNKLKLETLPTCLEILPYLQQSTHPETFTLLMLLHSLECLMRVCMMMRKERLSIR